MVYNPLVLKLYSSHSDVTSLGVTFLLFTLCLSGTFTVKKGEKTDNEVCAKVTLVLLCSASKHRNYSVNDSNFV